MVVDALKRLLLGGDGTDEEMSDEERLRRLFTERESGLDLVAEFGEPSADMQGKPTVVFPYVIFHNGEVYGRGQKQFEIPDNGTEDVDSPLVRFLTTVMDTHKDAVTVDSMFGVPGYTCDAEFDNFGDIIVHDGRPVDVDESDEDEP